MISLKDNKRKLDVVQINRDERIRISFYHNRNEGKKDKIMAESLD